MSTGIRAQPRDHVVHFYERDEQLVATVAEYLIEAVAADQVAIVVATPDHVLAFEAAMEKAGIDVAAARAGGLLIVADARAALDRFLVDDWPDSEAFSAVVGELVRSTAGNGRRVRVFGEMVALLWDAGQVAAAIELEDMWNELGREVPFSLCCAYPVQSVSGDDHATSFQRVCRCHSAVTGDMARRSRPKTRPKTRLTVMRAEEARVFSGDSSVLSATRKFVAETLESWDLEHFVEDASIIVSELATNAVIHARTDFIVALSSENGALRVSVRDGSHVIPIVRSPSPTTISGRGLILVTSLASRWGTEVVSDGKLIWAEISA